MEAILHRQLFQILFPIFNFGIFGTWAQNLEVLLNIIFLQNLHPNFIGAGHSKSKPAASLNVTAKIPESREIQLSSSLRAVLPVQRTT